MQSIQSPRPASLADALVTLKALRPELARQGGARLWLFGSRTRRDARPDSGWDVLVEFTEPPGLDDYMEVKFLLKEKLGDRVDLVSRAACKPRFLASIQNELLDVA